ELDIEKIKSDQFLAELDLSYKNYYLNTAFSSRKPDPLVLREKSFIYRLVSVSHQKSISSSMTWNPEGDFQVTGRVERIFYKSQSGNEDGNLQELSFSWYFVNSKITPSLTRISSWGGELLDYGLSYKYNIHNDLELQIQGDVAKIDKVNGISGWLYNAKGG